MRIRATKPEFWHSDRISSVSWEDRLLFKGVEHYVDDNGVGKDDVALIVSDIFPRDMFANPRDTVAKVSAGLERLHAAGLLWRYTVNGDRLLYVAFWEQSQRIDRPGKGRLPRPDGTMNYGDSDIRESVAIPRESVAPGTGEQGNRGTGTTSAPPPEDAPETDVLDGDIVDDEADRRGSTSTDIDIDIDTTKPVTAQTILAWLIDACRAEEIDLPKKLIGHYSKEIKNLLDEGQPPQRITAALRLMAEDNILNRPSLLPNKVMTVQTGPERAPRREKRSATDEAVEGWLALADQLGEVAA